MNRVHVINRLLTSIPQSRYLEIGLNRGGTFIRIQADCKIGIEPMWPRLQLFWYLLTNCRAKHFRMTSDAFFAGHSKVLEPGIDVAFVDGLHEYHQSLKDVQNCLRFLRPGGFIVMHDCNPASAAAAVPLPQKGREPGTWNGDVWKTIVYLRSQYPDLNAFVLDCDFGLGVITKGIPESTVLCTPDQIEAMSYDDLAADRKRFLNLKKTEYLEEFLAGRT
ncbi:MAG: class I SAM-dependent methyltransferase [Sedimentisphaerales bacterium]|nr:class I SAM-dependent methyltransferase [Sedimentisphaerales bacterium]